MEAQDTKNTPVKQVDIFNLFATDLPVEDQERRERLARNRRQPDTRRRAFFQELAIAVADELELRQAVDDKMACELADADSAQAEAARRAEQAREDAANPLIARFRDETGYKPGLYDAFDLGPYVRGDHRPSKVRKAVEWAIQAGILPQGTTDLPDTEGQYLALARWRPAKE